VPQHRSHLVNRRQWQANPAVFTIAFNTAHALVAYVRRTGSAAGTLRLTQKLARNLSTTFSGYLGKG
jgi:hypothetical protein